MEGGSWHALRRQEPLGREEMSMNRYGRLGSLALRLTIATAVLTTFAWSAAWWHVTIQGMTDSSITFMQVIAVLTACEVVVLYLVSEGKARHILIATPAVLILPAALAILAHQLQPDGIGSILTDVNAKATGYLVFPAGAAAVGLWFGIGIDLIIGAIRLTIQPDEHTS
jgi:hypothetical protein